MFDLMLGKYGQTPLKRTLKGGGGGGAKETPY